MRHSSHVKVNLICEGCNGRTQACVLVDREVPTPLRLQPGRLASDQGEWLPSTTESALR